MDHLTALANARMPFGKYKGRYLSDLPDAYPEEVWGCEDPRLTWLPEREEWAIAYTAYSRRGPLVSLATTKDFRSARRLGAVMPPEDKDAALFPRTFDGRWALIHRPVSTQPKHAAHIWLSWSPDLRHWGDHHVLLAAGEAGPVQTLRSTGADPRQWQV